MAAIDLGTESSGRKLERMLLGCALLAGAVVEAANGRGQAVFAGALAALALYLLASRHDAALDRRQKSILAAVDFFAVAALAALCDPSGVLWRAPTSIENLFLLTPSGAGTAVFVYLAGSVGLTGRSPLAIRAALFALPFLFCLLVALGSPVAVELGRAALLGFEAPEFVYTVVGRALVLFLVNEAVVVGAPLALGRFLPREWRPHGVLFLAALYAAVTPYIATAVSAYVTPWAPAPIAQIAAVLAAALAQAGLWGETYLVTQSLAGLLRGSASLSVIVFGDWKSGAEKGFVYGLVFMGLLLGANLILGFAPAVAVIHATGPLGAAILGALLFPLARAIVESTDSTPPFFGRLEAAYARNSNFARGVVAGVGAWLALYLDLPGWSGFDRFLFGAAVGALAFAGVDAALDALELREERRQHLRSWRVYALGTMLGGLVAGAIAWYLDSGQVATIVSKFHAYVSLDYRADGRPVNAYIIRPLFSKWGATDLGMADGGVRVFYDESSRFRASFNGCSRRPCSRSICSSSRRLSNEA